MFASVIGARHSGVATMIRSDHNRIPVIELLQKTCKPAIELLQCAAIARSVVAMPIQRVKVNQICKNYLMALLSPQAVDRFHSSVVVGSLHLMRQPPSAIYLPDFPHRGDTDASTCQGFGEQWPWRRQRKITPITSAHKIARLPHERAGDDARNSVGPLAYTTRMRAAGV